MMYDCDLNFCLTLNPQRKFCINVFFIVMPIIHVFVNSILQFVVVISLMLLSSSALAQLPCGQTIDFNTWNQEGSLPTGTWVVGAGGNSVEQTFNGAATWFVSPNDFINVLIQGTIQVNTTSDDDLVGFVFGYQDPIGALVNPASTPMKSFFFDWKQGTQTFQGMTCTEGFALYEVDGLFNFNGLVVQGSGQVYPEFWERVNTPIVTVLDTDYGNNGWNDFQQYDFQLKYTSDSIVIWIDGTKIFEENGCFEPGKFGFYNQSQDAVNYSNFSYNIEYDFDVSDTLICIGDTSFFEIGAGCTNSFPPTTTFNWDFDDGTVFSGINPFHIYTSPGIYQAELVSSDPFGCLDVSTQTIEVLGYPISNAGSDDTSCDLSYNLNATSPLGQWTALNGGILSDAALPNSSVVVPSSGLYTFVWEATNNAGCSTSDSVSITFNELTLTAAIIDPSCSGALNGEILLTITGVNQPFTFQWDAAAGNQISSLASNLGAGNYGVTVTDDLGCSIDSIFALSEPFPLNFTLTLDPADCDASNGSATISSISGGTSPYSYDWGNGLTPDNFSLGLAAGAYSVIISDDLGCDSIVTFEITNNPFSANVNVVEHISCFGFNDGEAIASGPIASGVYSYLWGATSNNQTSQTAGNLIPGMHTVIVSSIGSACSDTLNVTIIEPTILSISVSDLSMCIGDLTSLSATSSGGTQPYVFVWENSLGQSQNPIDLTATQTETFTVVVTDLNGCELSDSVTLTALEIPIASFTLDLDEACLRPSYSFTFQNTSTPTGGSVNWDFGDNSFGTGNTTSHTYLSPGVYSVSINIISPNGCSNVHVETDLITVFPNPTADFTFAPNIISTLNSNVQFIDLSYDDVSTWNWGFGSFSTSISQNPSHDFGSVSGNQIIFLEIENIYGCIDSTSRLIEIQDEISIYAPNSFTPDGDEFNQTWQVYLNGMDLFNIEINIYNRWGERVWQSLDVNVPWDGTYNGKIVQNGIYTWTFVASDLNNGDKYERVGHINVLR